jgi:hypothetical protein
MRHLTRREALLATLAAAGCAPLHQSVFPAAFEPSEGEASTSPVARAYIFLERMMDKYASGSTLRLAQSFVPTKASNLGSTAYVYDNAVAIAALLARHDVSRASVLGSALVYAQQHDSVGDGRIRSAYYTDPFVSHTGALSISDPSVDTGNMAWCGLALARLYQKTQNQAFLTAALAVAQWIYANTFDTRGPGGYTGGHGILWKSTENNLDVYAFFKMLAKLANESSWTTKGATALALAEAMWEAKHGFYWSGTLNDGKTPNTIPIPEDVQTWSFLATAQLSHARSIDWAEKNLSASDGPFSGVSFSNADRSGVWFEGTGHLAAALRARNAPGDAQRAAAYLADIAYAQAHALNADGYGIVAASKNGLRTGDGDKYFAALHIGATGWYALAASGANPFVLS